MEGRLCRSKDALSITCCGTKKIARLAEHTQNTLVYNTHISQGSVVMHLKYGGIFNDIFIANCLQSVPVKKIVKISEYLAKIWSLVACFLWTSWQKKVKVVILVVALLT